MTYSISVALADRQARDEMLVFLEQQDWEALHQTTRKNATGGGVWPLSVVGGEHLNYPPNRSPETLLGFNASLMPHAAWAVCAWVSVVACPKGQEPHFWYDAERMACVVHDDPNFKTRHFQVDSQGVMVLKPHAEPFALRVASLMLGHTGGRRKEQAWIAAMAADWRARQAIPQAPPGRHQRQPGP